MATWLTETNVWRKNRLYPALMLLALILVGFVGFQNSRLTSKGIFTTVPTMKIPWGLNRFHNDVNLMTSTPPEEAALPPHKCVTLPEFPNEGFYICVHPPDADKGISKTLMENRLWERALVLQMQKVLDLDSSVVLLDVGSNIGVYSLWAAVLGHRVVAVDMIPANLHLLQKSLYLNRVSHNVTLVNNGVYFDHRTLETIFVANSMGSTRINDTKERGLRVDKSKGRIEIRTICLNDLVPFLENQNVYMKMDIENSEHHALACADELFRKVNIRVVQMEWHRKTPDESGPILRFMADNGYVASLNSVQYKPVDLNTMQVDVFFLKKSDLNIT